MKARRGTGSIYRRGGIYWIKYYRNGVPYRESSQSDKEADARRLLRKRLGEITLGRFIGPEAERITVKDLAEDILNDYRVNGKKSLDGVQYRLKHILPYFGDRKAHEVGTDWVQKYILTRLDEGAANATINRELSALKRMYNLGLQAEKIHRKPYIRMLQEDNVRTGFFEHGEFLTVREVLPEALRPVATFAYYTGWRPQEIHNLTWTQVDLESQTIRLAVGTTKNKKGRIIVLDGELLEVLQAQWKNRKVTKLPGHSPTLLSSYVFHREGKQIRDFRAAWKTACDKAGLTGRLFIDFRRTGVRNMVRAGVPERVAMMVSGHKTRSVFERYNIVSEEDLKEAARKTWEHAQRQSIATKIMPLKKSGSSD